LKTKFVVSYAQNATPVHRPTLQALLRFCKENDAELLVVAGRYRNPTSLWSSKDENDDWWDASVAPYLVELRRELAPGLTLYGDISIQPTATRPLNGFEPFLGESSGIFGHPKRALETVPGRRTPRIMWTTGAVTQPNYTRTRAGKRAERHHVLGALVVDVAEDGKLFFCRHLCAGADGVFYDLGRKYSPKGSSRAPAALSLTLGDYHAGMEDEAVLDATKRLVEETRPENIILHDVLDFRTRNHHHRTVRSKFDHYSDTVEEEVHKACAGVRMVAGWGSHRTWVVRSNHDEAFERWLEESDPKLDPGNAEFYHRTWANAYGFRGLVGKWPNLFESAFRAGGGGENEGVEFLTRKSSLLLGGVEHAYHGDIGPNGTRGSSLAFTKLGVRVTHGHTHTPTIRDGVYSAGVTARLDHGYNLPPSTWVNAHVLQYADGKRTIITIYDGRYKNG
jgi:hypothetical protein